MKSVLGLSTTSGSTNPAVSQAPNGNSKCQILQPQDFEKSYIVYTHMVEGVDKLWHGDMVNFHRKRVVAFFGQIEMQGVPRRVLKIILSIELGDKSQKQKQPIQKKQLALMAPVPSTAAVRGFALRVVFDNAIFADFGRVLAGMGGAGL
ncbi:MAG: hypothetical protein Q9209_005268 [Squamulea sp. 1 TL-2023]